MDIKNKVIAVTGGGQGLGLSMALALAEKGARLALIDISAEALEGAVAQCCEAGGEARAYSANVSDEQQVESVFKAIITDFGALNGLINNAGVIRDSMLIKSDGEKVTDKMSMAQWQTVIDVNLTGVFLCAREAASQMVESNSKGVIVNISSISRVGNVGQTNYSAAKAGVAAMTVTWAKELSRYGIRCMGIAPGFVGTEMIMAMKEEVRDKMAAQIPLRRIGQPEEIASTAMFIFENDYLTGRVIDIDGGIRI